MQLQNKVLLHLAKSPNCWTFYTSHQEKVAGVKREVAGGAPAVAGLFWKLLNSKDIVLSI